MDLFDLKIVTIGLSQKNSRIIEIIGFGFTNVVTFNTLGSQIVIRSDKIRSKRVKPDRNCVCNSSPTDRTRLFCKWSISSNVPS